jgi:gluconokinase
MGIVVMGVSGCGKSTIGAALAESLGCTFLEGDAFHPIRNVEKMRQGIALDDEDRLPWLKRLASAAGDVARRHGTLVLSCSALRQCYRSTLQAHAGVPLLFAHLTVDRQQLERRMRGRLDHYMPVSLLDSQLALLEPPADDDTSWNFDSGRPVGALVEQIRAWVDGSNVSC